MSAQKQRAPVNPKCAADLADCPRLLQAIYTAVTLGNWAQPPHETKQAGS
jgi:hypothetical protein